MDSALHWSAGCQTNPVTSYSAGENKIHNTQYFIQILRGFRKFGQKKSWHLVGLICTLVCFPFIFQPCVIPEAGGQTQAIYYSVFAMVHCFGWASMQVSDYEMCPKH